MATSGRYSPNKVRSRIASNSWVDATPDLVVESFLVGGGGGGQGDRGGGGGGGEVLTSSGTYQTGVQYNLAVGAGGALGTGGFSIANPGSDGGTTFFANESAPGGKGAGLSGKLGGNGGSGGSGGNYTNSAYSLIGGSDGSDGQSTLGQNGLGSGETTRAFGSPTGTLYAGGGGGGSYESGSTTTGGAGGGGNGGKRLSSLNATPGGTNTGGGGGGGMEQGNGANGGSGIIILRYPTDFVADFSGGTQTLEKVQDGDYWVETIIGTESQNESVTFSFA